MDKGSFLKKIQVDNCVQYVLLKDKIKKTIFDTIP